MYHGHHKKSDLCYEGKNVSACNYIICLKRVNRNDVIKFAIRRVFCKNNDVDNVNYITAAHYNRVPNIDKNDD